MIFDTADLQRVPWELIAKEFRKNLGTSALGSIDEYAQKFFEFIQAHLGLFPSDYRAELFVRNVDQIMISLLAQSDDDQRVIDAGVDTNAADAARRAFLEEKGADIRAKPISSLFTQDDVDASYAEHNAALRVEAIIDIERFGSNTTFDPDALVRMAIDAIYRNPKSYLPTTGLVTSARTNISRRSSSLTVQVL